MIEFQNILSRKNKNNCKEKLQEETSLAETTNNNCSQTKNPNSTLN